MEVNLSRPRKGCFVVKTAGGVVVELLSMPRPFPKLKALDMDASAPRCRRSLSSSNDRNTRGARANA